MTKVLIEQLKQFLTGHMAHKNFKDAIHNFPMNKINERIQNIPYSFWHLLEHIRIAQEDIIEYIKDPDYVSPDWPKEYWPPKDKKATIDEWNATITGIERLYDESQLILDNNTLEDMSKKMQHVESDHSILREIIMIIAHNSYHIGQFVTMRMVINYPSKNEKSPI